MDYFIVVFFTLTSFSLFFILPFTESKRIHMIVGFCLVLNLIVLTLRLTGKI